MRDLLGRGTANGLEGLRWLARDEMREIEPHVGGVAALRVPQEGIADYAHVCAALVNKIEAASERVSLQARRRASGAPRWRMDGEHYSRRLHSGILVNCAGLQCDRVAELAGERRDMRILPFRGEYYQIKPQRRFLVRNLIYPVPDPSFPFLGVHFTRMIHGGIEAGPNAVRTGVRFTRGLSQTGFQCRATCLMRLAIQACGVFSGGILPWHGSNCGDRSAESCSAGRYSAWCRRFSPTIWKQ